MNTSQEFREFYDQSLKSTLKSLDEIRKNRLRAYLKLSLFLLATLLLIIVAGMQTWIPGVVKGILILLLVITLFYWIYRIIRVKKKFAYYSEFKSEVIRPIIEFISEELTYYPDRCISQGDYEKSRLFLQDVDSFKGDDLVRGKIDKTELRFSELHTRYKTTGSKGETHWHDIFKGIFFIADFNKDFEGSTILLPNNVGLGFSFFKKIFGLNRKEKLVELADPEFAENFTCYSTDDIKARYILSPALMQRLNKFHKKYPKNKVSLSFVNGKVFVAITYKKDLFEPGYWKSLVSYPKVKSYFDDIKLTVEIVHDLNLNNRIWTKE